MLAPPQCTMGGELPLGGRVSFSEVYSDPHGAFWAVDSTCTRVFYFSASTLTELMSSPSSLYSSSVAAPSSSSSAAETLILPETIFDCDGADRILSIVFPTVCDGKCVFGCIVTSDGCLALGDADTPTALLSQCDLGVQLTAAAAVSLPLRYSESKSTATSDATAPGVLVSSFDGVFTEVLFVQWEQQDEYPAGREVQATGLFRIRGRLHSLLLDESQERIVTVAERGDVDVWNWRRGADETLSFGMPSYHAELHGAPTAALFISLNSQLWIGTATGVLVVFVLRHCSEVKSEAATPRRLWEAHAGGRPVRRLLPMALGRQVWSCAGDRHALVWDAASLQLCGSFEFPAALLRAGPRCLHTTMWGVSEGSGAAAWFSVKEAMMIGTRGATTIGSEESRGGDEVMGQLQLLERDECVMKKNEAERLHILEALVSHLCSLLQDDTAREEQYHDHNEDGEDQEEEEVVEEEEVLELEGMEEIIKKRKSDIIQIQQLPPHVEIALQQLEEEQPVVRSIPLAVASLVSGQKMIERALIDEVPNSIGFLEYIQILLQERRRYRELQVQVRRCLMEIREELPFESLCEGLEDIPGAVRNLLQRYKTPTLSSIPSPCNQNQNGFITSVIRSSDGITTAVSPPAVVKDNQLQQLEAELIEERRRRQHMEVQLTEIEDEKRELQRQLTQSLRLQDEYENRNISLERLLKTAKKAAAVTSTEATRLSEMEANLHEAHYTVKTLHENIENLMRERQESSQLMEENKSLLKQISRFETKEQLAKQAFISFIETQTGLLEKLDDMLQSVDDIVNNDTISYISVMNLYEWLCTRVEEQRKFHTNLKLGYSQQYNGGEE